MIRKPILIFICNLFFVLGYAQPENTSFRSQFDDNSLSSSPQGVYYNDIWGYTDENGKEYAIVGTAEYTLFIEVTDPDNPTEVTRIASGQSCTWRDYKTFGHYAYGVADNCNAGLEIFDLSNLPSSVTKVYDSRTLIDDAHNIFIDTATARLYVCGINHVSNDLSVLDLAINPDTPTVISHIDLNLMDENDYVHDLYVKNDTAYLCNGSESRMLIYDVSNTSSIQLLGSVGTTGYNHSTWVSENGKVAVVADETHNRPLRVVDITNFDIPVETSTIKSTLLAPNHTNSIAHNPFIIGNNFAIISYYEDGLQIYKIDSINEPFRAGYYDTRPGNNNYSGFNGAWGTYPFLPSGNILVSDVDNGLFVITPNFPLNDCESNVQVSGTYDHHWELISKDSLEVKAAYKDSAEIRLLAPDQITLSGGFEITIGSELDAQIIDACPNSPALKLSSLQKPKD
tara:strand:+ start:627 stop:1991 length:1365 start_codon:yes stop_codon:yes gene_type:complete